MCAADCSPNRGYVYIRFAFYYNFVSFSMLCSWRSCYHYRTVVGRCLASSTSCRPYARACVCVHGYHSVPCSINVCPARAYATHETNQDRAECEQMHGSDRSYCRLAALPRTEFRCWWHCFVAIFTVTEAKLTSNKRWSSATV